jgi:hypothetical protein
MGWLHKRWASLEPLGKLLVSLIILAFTVTIASNLISGIATPNGELETWIELATCMNRATDITIRLGRGTYRGYTLRPQSDLDNQACAAMPPASTSQDIYLEADGGWRHGAKYTAVLMTPVNSYVSFKYELKDNTGRTLIPSTGVFLGPDEAYPWTAASYLIAGASPPPPPPPVWNSPPPPSPSPPPPGAYSCTKCWDTCYTASTSDGSCDDGGPGAEYSMCALGTDCTDCGPRSYTCGYASPPPPSPSPPGITSSSGCSNSCIYPSDGMCDDGGSGSLYSICNFGTDCTDCGTRSIGRRSRRLLFASAGDEADSLDGALPADAADAAGAADAADATASAAASTTTSPFGRRLLKGGSSSSSRSSSSSSSSRSSYSSSSSYSTSSRSSGGRSSTSGSGAWGSSSYSTSSYSPTATTTYRGTGSYGGRTSYYVNGRSYSVSSTSYSYTRGHAVYSGGSNIIIINRRHYGCYSCNGNQPRTQITGAVSEQITSDDLDRYVLDEFAFSAPGSGSAEWPLKLTVSDMIVFKGPYAYSLTSTGQEEQAYLGFTTSDGDAVENLERQLRPFGMSFLVPVLLITAFCFSCKKRAVLKNGGARAKPPSRQAFVINPIKVQGYPGASTLPVQPAYPKPVAMAVPMATPAMPMATPAMPMATPAMPMAAPMCGQQVFTTTTTTTTTVEMGGVPGPQPQMATPVAQAGWAGFGGAQ